MTTIADLSAAILPLIDAEISRLHTLRASVAAVAAGAFLAAPSAAGADPGKDPPPPATPRPARGQTDAPPPKTPERRAWKKRDPEADRALVAKILTEHGPQRHGKLLELTGFNGMALADALNDARFAKGPGKTGAWHLAPPSGSSSAGSTAT